MAPETNINLFEIIFCGTCKFHLRPVDSSFGRCNKVHKPVGAVIVAKSRTHTTNGCSYGSKLKEERVEQPVEDTRSKHKNLSDDS